MRKPHEGASALAKALGQNERAKDLVDECASDLSTANAVVRKGQQTPDARPALETVLKASEVVEGKVRAVSEQLTETNDELGNQVRDRELLDRQFAASQEQEGASRHAALHDRLSGLPNRALFDDRLEHELAHAKRYGWSMAVMFVDLDEFKQVNDCHGHDAGDAVLREVAQRLRDSSRADDTIARYGGDEFLILLTKVQNESDVAAVAQSFIQALRETHEFTSQDVTVNLTIKASIGISLYPRDGELPEQLIKKADAAMYHAKRAKCGYAFST